MYEAGIETALQLTREIRTIEERLDAVRLSIGWDVAQMLQPPLTRETAEIRAALKVCCDNTDTRLDNQRREREQALEQALRRSMQGADECVSELHDAMRTMRDSTLELEQATIDTLHTLRELATKQVRSVSA